MYCPNGWYSSQGFCMKAFEAATGLNEAEAEAQCAAVGGDLAQPFNDLESRNLATILANFTGNMTSTYFWIGKFLLLSTDGMIRSSHSALPCSNLSPPLSLGMLLDRGTIDLGDCFTSSLQPTKSNMMTENKQRNIKL